MKFIKNLFKPKEIIKSFSVPDYIVFNVHNFNNWFKHPNNNAVYAHLGIFLRLDKLSESHITDYLEKCYGIKEADYEKIKKFYSEIIKNWKN